jgi:hypothetical protein
VVKSRDFLEIKADKLVKKKKKSIEIALIINQTNFSAKLYDYPVNFT